MDRKIAARSHGFTAMSSYSASKAKARFLSALWLLFGIFFCLITGVSLVILPVYFAAGFIGIAGVVLLWTLPDVRVDLQPITRNSLFAFLVVNLVVPSYYTLILPGLPWINPRRLSLFLLVSLTALMISTSSERRSHVWALIRRSSTGYFAIGFLVIQALSVLTAISVPDSFRDFFNTSLLWYVPFLSALLVLKPKDVVPIIRIVILCAILNTVLGLIEFRLQHRFLHLALPESIRAQLYVENPRYLVMFTLGEFRNGAYRAASTFVTSLSWGEFSAMTAPLAAALIVMQGRRFDRILGVVGLLSCILAVFLSASRGAYLGLLTSLACFFFVWAYRLNRDNPERLLGGLIMAFYAVGLAGVTSAVFGIGAIRRVVIGGGAAQGSNDGRSIQWGLGIPKILERPFLGYGPSSSGVVVGFYPAGTEAGPTVDSYALTLLVDHGIPGFLAFAGILFAGIITSIRTYIATRKPPSEPILGLGAAIVAFTAYRPFLSQKENHFYMFIIVALIIILSHYSEKDQPKDRGRA